MERYTMRLPDDLGAVPVSGYGTPEILDRLAAYEDTGLEPEEVRHWKECIATPTMKHLVEMCGKIEAERDRYKKAEAEGRLVVLPCKVGDPVYYLTGNPIFASGYHVNRVESTKCVGFYFDEKGLQTCLYMPHRNHGTYWYFGKTGFLTREEAEAALKERGGT